MSDLPEDFLKPSGGKLGQQIYENPAGGIDPRLQFFLEISFVPFVLDGETVKPILRVDNVVVAAGSWRVLENETFEFPWAPKPGSVEAAVLLFGEHNPAEVTRLSFGGISDGNLFVSFDAEVDFEIEADREDLGQVEMSFALPLAVEPLRISTAFEKRHEGVEAEITAAVAALVDLNDYGSIEKVPGGFVFPVSPDFPASPE